MKKYAIVIPIYKESITKNELLSLNQLVKVCYNDDMFFVCPQELELSNYKTEKKINKKEFDKSYFESIYSYSKLCTSYELYDAFSDYEYILIYQLDAWIFKNDILNWCNTGYDYVGGPIFSPDSYWPDIMNNSRVPQVGNGGLSLRKVETMKTIFDRNGEVFNSLPEKIVEYINNGYPEDITICNIINKYYFINIASYRKALKFSWDFNCDYAYKLSGNNIPMAAHRVFANKIFWKNFIPELNTEEIVEEKVNEFKNIKSISENIIAILKEDNVM